MLTSPLKSAGSGLPSWPSPGGCLWVAYPAIPVQVADSDSLSGTRRLHGAAHQVTKWGLGLPQRLARVQVVQTPGASLGTGLGGPSVSKRTAPGTRDTGGGFARHTSARRNGPRCL